MATEAPDPRSFKSWEDAFKYPVPVVRKLEQQLRSNANDNREKLRTLVGASYRDLLGTAERIIEMDEQMQQAEATLGLLGQKCNSRAVDRIFGNCAKLHAQRRAQDHERYAFASQLAVLQSCPVVISRCLRKPGSLLLAAKILVIARLLHKKLTQASDVPPLIDTLRAQLGSLRQRILNRIDKQLADTEIDMHRLVQTMCAFSLATSSTPTDVLKHFHHVRMEAISSQFEEKDQIQEHILKALKLCTKTLQDTQAIFPRRLSDSLAKLKSVPLLQDPEVHAVTELDLDIHSLWVADEVRNYAPWPRHDQLQRPEAEKLLKSWSKQALGTFLTGTKTVLQALSDLSALVTLRKRLLEAWLTSRTRAPGIDLAAVLDDMREVLNTRIKSVIRSRASDLSWVSSLISSILDNSESLVDYQDGQLWNAITTSIDISNGAEAYKEAIGNKIRGCSEAVLQVSSTFERWMDTLLEVRAITKQIKETRWDDIYEDDDDDEFGLDSKQELLSEDDPRVLDETLIEATIAAFNALARELQAIVARFSAERGDQHAQEIMFLLRSFREIGQRLPILGIKISDTIPSRNPLTANLIEPLHGKLAKYSSSQALVSYGTYMQRVTRSSRLSARALWEGNPPVPIQPSPGTFKFLITLTTAMATSGRDLWTPGAVRVLKSMVSIEISTLLKKSAQVLSSTDESRTVPDGQIADDENSEGHRQEKPPDSNLNQAKKDKLTQLFFDALYLQRALTLPESKPASDDSIGKQLDEIVERADIDTSARERLVKNTTEYWKRTYLLFALLA